MIRLAALGLSFLALGSSSPPLDSALTHGLAQSGAPGAQAAVYRCGRLLWSGGAGVLDRKTQRQVRGDTLFVLASVTKTYTATMIMQLVQRGRLSLGTKLARFYPRMPNARKITIRMLLTHTSGLPEYVSGAYFDRGARNPQYRWDRDVLLANVHGSDFRPGTHYEYSNTNYVALGGILVKAGGKRVERALQDGVVKPLGLQATTFTYSAARKERYAHPYDGRDHFVAGLGIPSDYVGPIWTDGGITTTATELGRFGDGLFGGRLVGPASLDAMTTMNRFGSGFGLFPDSFDGHRWVGNSGSYGGFESELWADRSRGLTIAVTSNRDSSSDTIWSAVARAYDRLPATPPGCGGS